jgi:hypothetical protein
MRKITHRIATGVAALGLAVAGAAGIQTAEPASAASAAATCSSTQACFWDGKNATGTGPKVMSSCIRDFGDYSFDNRASSVWNRGVQDTLIVYSGTFASGSRGTVARGSAPVNFKSAWDNVVSSAYFASYDSSKYWKSATCR